MGSPSHVAFAIHPFMWRAAKYLSVSNVSSSCSFHISPMICWKYPPGCIYSTSDLIHLKHNSSSCLPPPPLYHPGAWLVNCWWRFHSNAVCKSLHLFPLTSKAFLQIDQWGEKWRTLKKKWSFNKAVERDTRLKTGRGWGGQNEGSGQTPITSEVGLQ